MIEYIIMAVSLGLSTYIFLYVEAWVTVHKRKMNLIELMSSMIAWTTIIAAVAPLFLIGYFKAGHEEILKDLIEIERKRAEK